MNKIGIPNDLLKRVKERLQETYGDRLKGVVLYGSEARGEATEDSDIDLLVLLDGQVKVVGDLEKIILAIRPVQLEIDRPIHATPAIFSDYQAGEFPLYLYAREEGVLL